MSDSDKKNLKLIEEIHFQDNDAKNIDWKSKAKILCEALPYMKRFAGEFFVIKIGGSAMGDKKMLKNFAQNIVLLKQVGINPIIIHGGGPQIGDMLEKLQIKSSFVDGMRVTGKDAVKIVEMVLSGSINKEIVQAITEAGGMAIGISGKDGGLVSAKKLHRTHRDPDSNIEKILDLGYVGEPCNVNPNVLLGFDNSDFIPVIAPIGTGSRGETYNINADTVAGAVAGAINACKLIILSDIDGVKADGEVISDLNVAMAKKLIDKKIINGGMIPKVRTCIKAIESEVGYAHILNGLVENILLMEIFTDQGVGTMISY